MRYIKTYGINGLLEWHGVLESGSVKMKVDFTNGSVTAYGVAPATFTTRDELTQHVIENSDKYKSGRIKLVSQREIAEEVIASKSVASDNGIAANEEVPNNPQKEGLQGSSDADVMEQVTVTCNDDAKEYLTEHFGVKSSEIRTRADMEKVAKEKGVQFVWV